MQLKPFCDENLDGVTENDWENVQQIIKTLEPFNKYSKKLQSETVTLSDFYGYWTLLRIKVSKSDDQLSQQLLIQMNDYHEVLMENPTLIATVYLDPRYQRGLGNRKQLAVKFLADVYEKITQIDATDNAPTAIETEENSKNDGDGSYEELDEYLNACNSAYDMARTFPSNTQNAKQTITKILNDFNGAELPLTASILEYWKEKSNTYPELYKLVSVMMAIPPTQTSVERAFSALAIVITSHRTKLGDECLQNILLVRLNHDLLTNNNLQTMNDIDKIDDEEVSDEAGDE